MQFVPDWFVTQGQIDLWHNDDYWNNDDDEDKLFEWYDGYEKPKAQKTSIKEKLLPISWHPSRYWDWCMSGDEKKKWVEAFCA